MFYIIPFSCGHGKSREYPVAIVDEKNNNKKSKQNMVISMVRNALTIGGKINDCKRLW